MTVPPPSSGPRNAALDGLRGIAALSVALGHCVVQVTGLPLWATSMRDFPSMPAADIGMRVLSALFPSDAAVMVFFVLSGHVLWGSFQRKQLGFFADLPDYACSRVYRLFPLAIVSALPLGLLSSAPAAELVRNMLLLSNSLNGVLWSLQVEVVASLALFALWGITRGNRRGLLLGLLLGFAATPFFRGHGNVVFFPAFVLGASISSIPPRLWNRWWITGTGIAVLIFTNVVLGHGGITRCFEMAGATVLVGAVANGRIPILSMRVPLFLGAISYPFYLTHFIGMSAADHLLVLLPAAPSLVMIAGIAIVSVAVTIPVAWLLHVFVENPVLRARPRLRW
ncbi:acyltransferase [Acidisphaera sp. S103]|uniref:acyltransferase family protein n=1 Tax=Acidisphaera sp. S103 TaxID=1747223 RepID=UPI00131CC709|nr:acyltransferase [Acidisphaera sp. S103]